MSSEDVCKGRVDVRVISTYIFAVHIYDEMIYTPIDNTSQGDSTIYDACSLHRLVISHARG